MVLRESTTVNECCNKIVESIANAPTSGQNGGICGDQTVFGDTLHLVNTADLVGKIHEGTYVVSQRDPEFIYSCDGCIKSIQLAVSPTSVLKDAQGQERIKFHTFAETGDNSTFQRIEDVAMWDSSVVNTTMNRKVVDYRPIGFNKVCFSQGDVFGFTVEAGSDITVLTRFPADPHIIHSVSRTLETISGCPQLSDSGLYTITGSFSLVPLIHIVTGKNFLLYIHCNIRYINLLFCRGFPTN